MQRASWSSTLLDGLMFDRSKIAGFAMHGIVSRLKARYSRVVHLQLARM
jgi:hypothetical protein